MQVQGTAVMEQPTDLPFPALTGEGARSVFPFRPSPVNGVRQLVNLELTAVIYATDAATGADYDDAALLAGITEVVSRLSVFGVERYGAMLWGEDLAQGEGRTATYALWPDAKRLSWARTLAFGMDVRVNITDSTVVYAGLSGLGRALVANGEATPGGQDVAA